MDKENTTVCVAGASGLVGAHLVKSLLEAGYRVNGTLRDASNLDKAPWLMALPGAAERLTLYSARMDDEESFLAPLAGTDAVFIACLVPIYHGVDGTPATELDDERGWTEIIRPIEQGALNIMRAADRQGVRNVLICSSTSSTNPKVPAAVKNEVDHHSDVDHQISQRKFTSAEKTVMEASARAFAAAHAQRLCVFLPTTMLGPVILPEHLERGMHKRFIDFLDGRKSGPEQVPAGSVSLAHLEDIAALFLAAYRNPEASGRYYAVYESWPWRDIYAEIARHVPASGLPKPLNGDPEPPTQFDFTRRDSLGVRLRDIPTTIAETFDWLKTGPFHTRAK